MFNIAVSATGVLYQRVCKPIIFRRNPEKVHDITVSSAHMVSNLPPVKSLLRTMWRYDHPLLNNKVDAIDYTNPIGLAAGWDKDAKAFAAMQAIGFGFTEVGSITKYAYEGNDGTRLWRLPESKSIAVYYGLKNDGVDVIAPRIQSTVSTIPLGTNIARTNSPNCDDKNSIEDYAYSFSALASIGDYFTINVSCPNTFGGQPFHDKKRLNQLLTELDTIPTSKPVYVKISPDISTKERKDIAELAFQHRIHGFICGNLTKDRTLSTIKDRQIPDRGGFSGKIVEPLANKLIADMYRYTEGKKTIIGLGGVFTANDAYTKIKLGASLVQIITGLIYQGPQTVGLINKELVQLLQNDSFTSINQAIGIENSIS